MRRLPDSLRPPSGSGYGYVIRGGGEVDLVIRKSGYRLAFCVGVFLVRGCSVGIYPLGADSSLETREGRCESCLNLAATAAV